MRRVALPLLLALTACTGGAASSGPPPAPEPPPVSTPAPSPPAPPLLRSGESPEVATPRAILTGTVTYLPRIALTPEAVVQVELRDVSDPETEAALVAKEVIEKPGQVPIAFSLEYDPAAIVQGRRYAVSARISDRGQLQFVTDTQVPVLGSEASGAAEIVVVPVR